MDEQKTPGEFVSDLANKGWPDVNRLLAWFDDMAKTFGGKKPNVGFRAYPKGVPLAERKGTQHFIELPTGQTVWMTVSNEGELLERGYSDRGDVHFKDVENVIRRWHKTIGQSGPKAGGTQQERQDTYNRYKAIKRYNPGLNMDELAQETGVSRSHLYDLINELEDED